MRALDAAPLIVTDASSMPARLTASSDNVTTTSDDGTLDTLDDVFVPVSGCDCAAGDVGAAGWRGISWTALIPAERRISRYVAPAPAASSAMTATISIGHRSVTREFP